MARRAALAAEAATTTRAAAAMDGDDIRMTKPGEPRAVGGRLSFSRPFPLARARALFTSVEARRTTHT